MTAPSRARKPAKPRKDYPLFAHACGQWAKKVNGKMHYFGPWDAPKSAEIKWDQQKHALIEGRDPNHSVPGETVGWLCNAFLDFKEQQRLDGDLAQRTFDDYRSVCRSIADFFGRGRILDSVRPVDFQSYRDSLSKTWSPATKNMHLRYARAVFNYANDIEATERPFKFQLGLKPVSARSVRLHASEGHAKEFSRDELLLLYNTAKMPMRAFILLGINCAFGQTDIARQRRDKIDLDSGWVGEPRGKTGLSRGSWLWPETRKAVQEAIDMRPETNDQELNQLAFLTRQRRPWAVDGAGKSQPLTLAFSRLKTKVGIDKKNVGFYALRHTFATQASNTHDQQAVNYVMGHTDRSMHNNYNEGIDPQRVVDVCQHVKAWLFG